MIIRQSIDFTQNQHGMWYGQHHDRMKHQISAVIHGPGARHFFWAHLVTWTLAALIGGWIIWVFDSIGTSFVDSMFISVSAVTSTGLSTVPFFQLSTVQHAVVLFLVFIGGPVIDALYIVLLKWSLWRPVGSRQQSQDIIQEHVMMISFRQEQGAIAVAVWLLLMYLIGVQLIAFVAFWLYLKWYSVDILDHNGITSPAWFSIFHTINGFNNSGFGLLSDSLVQFQRQSFPLVMLSILFMAGFTPFPIFLRWMTWITHQLMTMACNNHRATASLHYLLRNPRRITTAMFPSSYTRYLLGILVLIWVIQLSDYLIFSWNCMPAEMNTLNKVINSIFQVSSSRTAGFNTVNISALHPGTQVMIAIMMFISAIPVSVTTRSTRTKPGIGEEGEVEGISVGSQMKRMAFWDSTWLFLPFYLICTIEGDRLMNDPQHFTYFKVLFECCSAYGTVGLSLGYPGSLCSFSAQWSTASKLLLMVSMMLGRHRGFPDHLDQALLPTCSLSSRPFEVHSRVSSLMITQSIN